MVVAIEEEIGLAHGGEGLYSNWDLAWDVTVLAPLQIPTWTAELKRLSSPEFLKYCFTKSMD